MFASSDSGSMLRSVFVLPFLSFPHPMMAVVAVGIAQRFPKTGGRGLCVHGSGSVHGPSLGISLSPSVATGLSA